LVSLVFTETYACPLEQFLIGHQVLYLTYWGNFRYVTTLFLGLGLFKHGLDLLNVFSHTFGNLLIVVKISNFEEVVNVVLLGVSQEIRNFFNLL